MQCPECDGDMRVFMNSLSSRPHGRCDNCRYVVSWDMVSGYWGGYRAGYIDGRDKKVHRLKDIMDKENN